MQVKYSNIFRGLTVGSIFLILILFLNSCAVGPDYEKPKVELPKEYKEAQKNWKVSDPSDHKDKGKWWLIFNDEDLNMLEEKINLNNQTVIQAKAQYDQAKALVDQANAGFFPTVGANVSYTKSRSATTNTTLSKTTNNYSASLQAGWEPDIWGSVRRSAEGARSGSEASAANLVNVKLIEQALLAQNYFQIRASDHAQKILDDTVTKYQKILDLTNGQYQSGIAKLSDVLTVKTQLKSAQASALDNKIIRAQLEHALAILLGISPSDFSLPVKENPFQIPEIPQTVPSQLLERRPDIASSERLVAQANAQIGVAVASYFPSLNLGGEMGYQNAMRNIWFDAPSLFWSIGPALVATLFDGGLRSAKIAAAKASYQSSVASYRQTVLVAFQEVEDNLVALNTLKQEIQVQNESYLAAKQAEDLINKQYQAGSANLLQLITAELTAFTSEKTLNDLKGRSLVAAVNLTKAMGGGW